MTLLLSNNPLCYEATIPIPILFVFIQMEASQLIFTVWAEGEDHFACCLGTLRAGLAWSSLASWKKQCTWKVIREVCLGDNNLSLNTNLFLLNESCLNKMEAFFKSACFKPFSLPHKRVIDSNNRGHLWVGKGVGIHMSFAAP